MPRQRRNASSSAPRGQRRPVLSQKRSRPPTHSPRKVYGLRRAIRPLNGPYPGCAADGCALPRMPSERVKGERLLEDALRGLARALSASGAPWMVIGGIAIIAHGVRRFTTDIDATVRGDAVRPEELLEVCEVYGIRPRIRDALAFARANLVLLLRHQATGVDLDVSFAWSPFEHDALSTAKRMQFGRVRVPMCTPENLVVFKAIAGRARDAEDAEALLVLYPDIDVARVRRRVSELSKLAEAPELVSAFEKVVSAAHAQTSTRGRSKPPRKLARPAKKKRAGKRT